MAVYDMNVPSLRDALNKIENLPDDVFSFLLSDTDAVEAIRKQLYIPITTKNTHMSKQDTDAFFNITTISAPNNQCQITQDNNSPRDLINRFVAYYGMRIINTPPRNRGLLKNNIKCIGMGDNNLDWIIRTCNNAGIETEAPNTKQSKTNNSSKREQRLKDINDTVRTPSADGKPKTMQKIKTVELDQREVISVLNQQSKEPDTNINLSVISPDCFWDYQTACDIVNAEPEPYLIEGLIRKGTINIIGATPNSGKTTFVFDAFGAIASGAKFLTNPKDSNSGFETHQGPCLFIDFDGDKVDTASRLRATIDTYSEITGIEPKNIPFIVRWMPADWTGSDDKFAEKIYKEVSALPSPYNKPSVIAFDTYTAFANVENENEATQAQKVFSGLKKLKAMFTDYDLTIVLTMHLRKTNVDFSSLTMDDLRGTGATAGAGSDIWLLGEVKDNPDTKKLRQVKSKGRSRDTEIKTLSLAYDNNDDGSYSRVRFFMTEGTDEATAKKKLTARRQLNNKKRAKDIISFVATHPNCSLNRICKGDRSGKDRLEIGIKTAKVIVDELIADGKLYNLSPDNGLYSLVINPNQTQDDTTE